MPITKHNLVKRPEHLAQTIRLAFQRKQAGPVLAMCRAQTALLVMAGRAGTAGERRRKKTDCCRRGGTGWRFAAGHARRRRCYHADAEYDAMHLCESCVSRLSAP